MTSYEVKASALETVYRLGFALDALNYQELTPLFYPERRFHFDIYAILKTPAREVTLPEYFKMATGGLGGFDGTQHLLSSPIVTMESETKAHVKTMVSAFHALLVDGVVEGATARVTWNIDLEKHENQWLIVRWRVAGVAPMDRPDLMQKAHENAHNGKLRPGIVGPVSLSNRQSLTC